MSTYIYINIICIIYKSIISNVYIYIYICGTTSSLAASERLASACEPPGSLPRLTPVAQNGKPQTYIHTIHTYNTYIHTLHTHNTYIQHIHTYNTYIHTIHTYNTYNTYIRTIHTYNTYIHTLGDQRMRGCWSF